MSVSTTSTVPLKTSVPQKTAMTVAKMFLLLLFIGLVTSILAIGRFSTKKVKLTPELIDNLAVANLTKRPLNLYITANGVHADAKKLQLSDGSSHFLITPPFDIKWRSSMIISTSENQIYTAHRPSLLQMSAAAGLHTFLPINQTTSTMHPVISFVSKLNRIDLGQKWILLIDGTASPLSEADLQLANNLGLEAVVLIKRGSRQPVSNFLGFEKPVLLITDSLNEKTNKLSVNELINAQKVKLNDGDNVNDPKAIMQVLQNFFDLLHPR